MFNRGPTQFLQDWWDGWTSHDEKSTKWMTVLNISACTSEQRMKGPRVIHSLLSINRSGQNFYWFYKIQFKYMKERVNNVGMVILLAIFLWVSKWMKQWNKWISLGSRECYRNKQWANGCHNLQLNLEIPKTFLRTKYLKVWKANFKIQTTRKFILGRLLITC